MKIRGERIRTYQNVSERIRTPPLSI